MKKVLITGVNGEIGHALLKKLTNNQVVAVDKNEILPQLREFISDSFKVDIRDFEALSQVFTKHKDIDTVIHLAALLSAAGEKDRHLTHDVNSGGTLNLLELSSNAKFFFPSSIATYGIKDLETKRISGKVREDQYQTPITIYGASKIYGEVLGNYYQSLGRVDFRSLRFPGLISFETAPSTGTSDFGPGILHAGRNDASYECFVREDTKIPFMFMEDAIGAILKLLETPKEKLTSHVYNVTSFSLAAKDFEEIAKRKNPEVQITYNSDPVRQKIADSWPQDLDDSKARSDWGWEPVYTLSKLSQRYLEA